MKSILSSVFALVALFSVSTTVAQKANPKISNPDKDDVRISCSYSGGSYTICVDYARITGLGNASSVEASLTAVAKADVYCYSRGQQKKEDAKFIPGQSTTATGNTVTLQASNGVLVIQGCSVSVTISGSCKNTNDSNGFTSEVTNVQVSDLYLTLNGSKVSLKDYISQLDCQN
jgi:hypothetical protein